MCIRDRSYILIIWDSSDPDWPRFLSIAQESGAIRSLLPAVFAVEPRHGLILEEDLGDRRLKDAVAGGVPACRAEKIYRRVLDALLVWHSHAIAKGSAIAERRMDEEMFLWESDYFAVHCAAEYFGLERMLDGKWQRERRALACEAAGLAHVRMHRDFQSENIMIGRRWVKFVDFQGARLGPAEYDLAALLHDPYVPLLDEALAERLFEYYAARSAHPIGRRAFYIASIQRLLQALGAFANLSLHKGKERYREFIPVALERLERVLTRVDGFGAIGSIVKACRGAAC